MARFPDGIRRPRRKGDRIVYPNNWNLIVAACFFALWGFIILVAYYQTHSHPIDTSKTLDDIVALLLVCGPFYIAFWFASKSLWLDAEGIHQRRGFLRTTVCWKDIHKIENENLGRRGTVYFVRPVNGRPIRINNKHYDVWDILDRIHQGTFVLPKEGEVLGGRRF